MRQDEGKRPKKAENRRDFAIEAAFSPSSDVRYGVAKTLEDGKLRKPGLFEVPFNCWRETPTAATAGNNPGHIQGEYT